MDTIDTQRSARLYLALIAVTSIKAAIITRLVFWGGATPARQCEEAPDDAPKQVACVTLHIRPR
jgi:hypothetical protein